MGIQPTKKTLEGLIRECSKIGDAKNNNYKIEYQNDQEMDLYTEDDDSVYKFKDGRDNIIFSDIKDPHIFPYIAFGILLFKYENGEHKEQICFLINKRILMTYYDFYQEKKILEIKNSFSDEILNLNTAKKNEKKNILIFFLEKKTFSKWIGVDDYNTFLLSEKTNNKYISNNILKIIFLREKKEYEKSQNLSFVEIDYNNNYNFSYLENDKEHIFTEFYCDIKNINNFKNKNLIYKKSIPGSVIYYYNKNTGGAYVLGLIDSDLAPIFFDNEILNFLYGIIIGRTINSVCLVDQNIVELDFSRRNLGPGHIKLLTDFNLTNLKKLNLLKNQIGPQGAFYLGQSKFNNLENLILNFNYIGDEGVEYISKGPFLNLKYLYLFHNNLSNTSVKYILEAIFVDTLLLLDLSDNPNINNEAIRSIKEKTLKNNNVLKDLRNFDLSNININDKALDLIQKINFQKLKKLVIKGNKFTDNENIKRMLNNVNYKVVYDTIKINNK